MVYFNKINGDKQVVQAKKTVPVQTQQGTVKVVPIGQSQEQKSEDPDKLPQGYYVEKSQDAPSPEPTDTPVDEVKGTPSPEPTEAPAEDDNDDSLPDTKMHTDERIEMSESITIANDEIQPITDALDNAIRRGQNITFKKFNSDDNDVDDLTNAESMVKHDTFKPLDMDYKKGFHLSGLARFEYNDFNYNVDETGADIKWTSDSKRIDLKGTYENKSGKTKLLGYVKGAVTNDKLSIGVNVTDASEQLPDLSNLRTRNTEYCAYLGLKQKFNNGTTLSATGLHDKNETHDAHTTEIDALYDLGFADITGSTTIYKIGNQKSTVKTNLSCKFKMPETPSDEKTDEEQTVPEQNKEQTVAEQDEEQKPQTTNTNDKKWTKKSGLLLEFESEGDNEQGIGYYWDFKKRTPTSKTRFTVFGKGSTTQRGEDESSSYHITAGANLQYKERINSKLLFDANLDVKDKITFGGNDKGNITTAFGTARLTSQRFIAELESKMILAHDTYKALALRLAYKLSPKVEISAEASAVNQNDNGTRLKGYTGLATVHVKL